MPPGCRRRSPAPKGPHRQPPRGPRRGPGEASKRLRGAFQEEAPRGRSLWSKAHGRRRDGPKAA
eukprot:8755861-Pyramimonas_sp.AAC.1